MNLWLYKAPPWWGQRVSRSNFCTIELHTWQASGLPRAELDDEVEGVLDGARIGERCRSHWKGTHGHA